MRAPRRRRINEGGETITTRSIVEVQDLFPVFEPEKDLQVGQFVVLTVEATKVKPGVPFYVGKVLEFGQQKWATKMKVEWYWPILKARVGRREISSKDQYTNYIEASWEPSGERHGWVEKEATIFSWNDIPKRTRSGFVQENNVSMYRDIT